MSRILIIEDEPRIASFLEKGLKSNGFETDVVDDGEVAAERARDADFDLAILDLGLPGKDGFTVLSELRARGEMLPVLILTARDDVDDTVAGLDLGADDYITKPFRFEELLARVRARLRTAPSELLTLQHGEVTLDLRSRTATVGDTTVELTSREFALAEMFFRNPGAVLSRDEILRHVWNEDVETASNVVDVYVLYLRRKLGDHLVQTVRGKGYRLADPVPH